MSEKIKIGILGGDRRMIKAISCLSSNYECAVWGFSKLYGTESEKHLKDSVRCIDCDSAIRGSDAIILPLPATSDGVRLNAPLSAKGGEGDDVRLSSIAEKMKKGSLLLGGMLPPLFKRYAAEHGINVQDYYDSEEMQILNSVPTAEGAICACMEELDVTVSGMRAAVVGYGRVGRTLATRLRALGADVFAVARSKRDLSWAKCDGCIPIPLDEYRSVPVRCGAVFNTVPSLVFDGELLSLVGRDTVIFELASKNAGVDIKTAEEKGIKVVSLPSLPGKTSPETAGEVICSVVGSMIENYFAGYDTLRGTK